MVMLLCVARIGVWRERREGEGMRGGGAEVVKSGSWSWLTTQSHW